MFRHLLRYFATILVLLCFITALVSAGSCCFFTRTTSVGNNTYNINVTAVYSDINEHNNIYRAIISIPTQYRFVGKATGGATCNNAAVATSYDCTSNNSPKFNTQISVQSVSSTNNNPALNITVYRDQCQQSDSCPDVMVDSNNIGSSSSDDETIYLGPFGNVTKPVAIAIGVAFGVIIIGVAYTVLRRIFSNRSGGGNGFLVRSSRNNANNNGNIIPMQSRGNHKDDGPDAASYNNPNGGGGSGGIRNTLRQNRLWGAISDNRGTSSNTGNNRRWRKERDDGYTNVDDEMPPVHTRSTTATTAASPNPTTTANNKNYETNLPINTLIKSATLPVTASVIINDMAEILPPKNSTRNANPQTMMTSVVVDMGVEPAAAAAPSSNRSRCHDRDPYSPTAPSSRSVSRSASRTASRQPSVHRSGTSRRTNATQKSQTALVPGTSTHDVDDNYHSGRKGTSVSRHRSVHRSTDDDMVLMSQSSTMKSGNKTAPSDVAMRRSKSTSKASTRSTSGHNSSSNSSSSHGNRTHRRTVSSHDNTSSSKHQRSRSRSSQRRPARLVGDAEEEEPSMPNDLDLALLSRKLNQQQQQQQQRNYDDRHDLLPVGILRSRETSNVPRLTTH